jgi:hypothetical protein
VKPGLGFYSPRVNKNSTIVFVWIYKGTGSALLLCKNKSMSLPHSKKTKYIDSEIKNNGGQQ